MEDKIRDLILLLVSPDFIASDYIWNVEITKAMERHRSRQAIVIPIILKPCDWKDMPFAGIQGLPRDAKPVSKFDDQDEAFHQVAQGIRGVIARVG